MVQKITNLDKAMVKVYVRRIRRGDITIDDVPERIRNLVSQALEA